MLTFCIKVGDLRGVSLSFDLDVVMFFWRVQHLSVVAGCLVEAVVLFTMTLVAANVSERIASFRLLSARVDLKRETIVHGIHIRLNQFDVCVTLEGISCLVGVLWEFVRWHLLLKGNPFETVSFGLAVHNTHDLLEHVLVLRIDLTHLTVALVDAARTQVVVAPRKTLVDATLQIDKFVDKMLPLLSLHKHGSWIARQLWIHRFSSFMLISSFLRSINQL